MPPKNKNLISGKQPTFSAQQKEFAKNLTKARQLSSARDYKKAIALCREVLLPQQPDNYDVLLLAGMACLHLGDYVSAEFFLEKTIALKPKAEVIANRGIALWRLKRWEEAETCYRQTLALAPKDYNCLNNLGVLLMTKKPSPDYEGALDCYKKAIALKSDYADAHANMGTVYRFMKNDTAAEEAYSIALKYQPRHDNALRRLGNLFEKQRRPEEALRCYRALSALRPNDPKAIGDALRVRCDIADWDEKAAPSAQQLMQAMRQAQPDGLQTFHLLAMPEGNGQFHRYAAQCYAHAIWKNQLAAPSMTSLPSPKAGARIRLGYISSDFRNHPVAHLVSDVIAAHDREHFEVFLYSEGDHSKTKEYAFLQNAADKFRHIHELSDQQAAELIREDGINILIDLTGYTGEPRVGVNALRPAPAIVSWIGYVGSMGAPRVADYIIGDAIVTPPEKAGDFSETLALMPTCFQPNKALTDLLPAPSRAEEGLPESSLVFCSFNQTFKLNAQLWDDWCHILAAVSNSVLWLTKPLLSPTEGNLLRETEKRGIDPGRLVFSSRKPLEEHRARLSLADIALDTYPYNSGATASDTLRAGVPLVTYLGETFASRMASSLLTALGLPELVAPNREAYVRLAIQVAQDETWRQALRSKINQQLSETSLFKPEKFVAELEALFRVIQRQSESGQRKIIIPNNHGSYDLPTIS